MKEMMDKKKMAMKDRVAKDPKDVKPAKKKAPSKDELMDLMAEMQSHLDMMTECMGKVMGMVGGNSDEDY